MLEILEKENKEYLTTQIVTYIGNKRLLTQAISAQIEKVLKTLNKKRFTSSLDLFSGTGIVARWLRYYSDLIYVNDLEDYSYALNKCFLSSLKNDVKEDIKIKMIELERNFNYVYSQNVRKYWGWCLENYAPKDDGNIQFGERCFYTTRNAKYIDFTLEFIKDFPEKIKNIFLASLITEASINVNTSGVFKSFYKNRQGIGQFGGEGKNALSRILKFIKVTMPVQSNFDIPYVLLKGDATKFVKQSNLINLDFDFVYLDPPYNQHAYGGNYFMLNLIANNQVDKNNLSKISGIPKNWNRSKFNQKHFAFSELEKIIENLRAKFILLSYSSESFFNYDQITGMLKKYGKLEVQEIDYKSYKAGRSKESHKIKEYLFLLQK